MTSPSSPSSPTPPPSALHADCRDAVAELYHYLDGELTDDRRNRIRHHLDDCSPCLDAFDFQTRLRALVTQRCRAEVPDELRERVFAALRALDS